MPTWTHNDIPDQSGRTAIVTGANSGIGFETARALAKRGAHVVLACRDLAKGRSALDRIRAERGDVSIEVMQLDLVDLRFGHGVRGPLRGRARAARSPGPQRWRDGAAREPDGAGIRAPDRRQPPRSLRAHGSAAAAHRGHRRRAHRRRLEHRVGDDFGPDGRLQMRGHPKRVPMVKRASDRATAKRLFDLSEELTGVRFRVGA